MELARLHGWLRNAKGRRTFDSLARRASAQKMPVSACTLRRALDGRLPTPYTVRAFARGAGADEEEAGRVWAAAEAAVRPRPAQAPARAPAVYVPGDKITTRAGLARALEKVRASAGNPSLRRLARSPEAAGRLSRSALHNALTRQRLPSEDLLTAFAAACDAGEDTTRALLAARTRILAGPQPPSRAGYPCEIAERAETRRAQDTDVRHWIKDEDDLDWYQRQQRDEEEAEEWRTAVWDEDDDLADDENEEAQQARPAAGTGRDLRAGRRGTGCVA